MSFLHPDHVTIAAELSCNHEGSLSIALDLIEAAAEAGADAIKFQLWLDPDEMTRASDDPRYTIRSGQWKDRRLHELYRDAQTPLDWFPELFHHAKAMGLVPFATPFSLQAVDELEKLDCPAYKIASPEIGYLELIRHAAKTKKPIILSTGLANDQELGDAMESALEAGEWVLLHCVSAYPTLPDQVNLGRLRDLRMFGPDAVGFSDHTRGSQAAIMAVALGARMLEKHLMRNRPNQSLDGAFAATPREFAEYVTAVREAEKMLKVSTADEGEQFKRRLVDGRWVRCAP